MPDVTTGLVKTALRTLHYTGADKALAPLTAGRGVIFMLHHVRADVPNAFSPNRILSITPAFFERVIEQVLERDFDIVTLDEAHDRMVSPTQAGRRFAAFTFDDGYADNIGQALPICRRYGVPMHIYIAPDFCDHAGRAWWLSLEAILAKSDNISVAFDTGQRDLPLRTPSEKNIAWRAIYPWLRTKSDNAIHDQVDAWAMTAGVDPLAACRELVMTWDEVRAAAKNPLVSFGAHTMSHTALAKCSATEAQWQIAASVEHLEHQLRTDCRHFAYPYGDPSAAGEREFAIARDLGLKTAVTTRKGLIDANARDRLTALPRLSLNGDYQEESLVKVLLSGAPFKMLDLARAAKTALGARAPASA